MAVAFRGLLWLASAVGLGAWFGGDDIENQTVIQETSIAEKVFWSILLGVLLYIIACLVAGKTKTWKLWK